MKRCTQCGTIHSDTEEPFIFCVRCGSHKWEPVGDELPFGESEQNEETNRETLLGAMMADDERNGLYDEKTTL